MLKTVVLSAAAALVIAVDWLRFEEPRSGGGRPFVLAALAIAAVLLRPLWLRLVGVALAALIAASVAFSLSPLALWPGGDGFFGPIGSRFSRGFLDFYDFRLPIDPTTHPAMHAVILVAIFGFTLAVALAVASRQRAPGRRVLLHRRRLARDAPLRRATSSVAVSQSLRWRSHCSPA